LSAFFRPIVFVLGLLITAMGVAMLPPLAANFAADSQNWRAFATSSSVSFFIGLLLVSVTVGPRISFDIRQGFLLTSSSWFILSAIGALPFAFSNLEMTVADTFFESASGLTTTGSTVIAGLDRMPAGILLWRAMLQWIGGAGIIVMAIAMLPYLRVGGMQLFRTESSDRSEKVFPRAAQIATANTVAYLLLSGACALAYYFSGMSGFEAVTHAMTTLATGGYSTSDASFGHFTNPVTHWIAILFMTLGGLPFVVYIQMAYGRRPLAIWQDSQARHFLIVLTVVVLAITLWLWTTREIAFSEALRLVAFNVVSVVTTTGYANADYSQWGGFAVMAFLFLTFVGGCTGSTSGGIKALRFELVFTFIWHQILRLCRPRAIFPLTYRGRPLELEVIRSALMFFFLYIATFIVLSLALAAIGLDVLTAISGAATAVGNVGPGLGDIIGPAGNFAPLPDSAKWILSVGMLMGRLELLTLLILLVPAFWKP
jgi:trk system potassium uptake protein TrkH